jgi:hypothetical protein
MRYDEAVSLAVRLAEQGAQPYYLSQWCGDISSSKPETDTGAVRVGPKGQRNDAEANQPR